MKSNLSDPDITELSSTFPRAENESRLQLWFTWEWLTEILLCVRTKKAVSWWGNTAIIQSLMQCEKNYGRG